MTTEPAPAARPALEVHVTLTGADVCRFAIDDDALARRTLADIHPTRLFAAPQLLLGGDASLSVFATAHVERVDLIGASLPDWPFLAGATGVREVSAEEFGASYDPARYAADRLHAGREPGSPQIGFTEYRMASGSRLFWEVTMASLALTPVDFRPFIQSLFAAGGLHARTAEGGVAILNPSQIARMTFHPGPPALPAGAWPAHRL